VPHNQRTARVMTSGGKRYPAKANLGAGRTGGRRRDLIARVSPMPTPAANATVPAVPGLGVGVLASRRGSLVAIVDLFLV
jgi:hypothetical protein